MDYDSLKVLKAAFILVAAVAILVFFWSFRERIVGLVDLNGFSSSGGWQWFSFSSPQGGTPVQSGGVNSGSQEEEKKVYTDLPEGFSDGDASEYYGRVRITASAISENASYLQNPSTIRLYVQPKAGESINLTGWKIQGNRGALFVPKAVDQFKPPYGGAEEDIIIKDKSATLNIYSSTSSLGKNFRTNRCIGYVTRNYDFKPNLSGSCYRIPDTEYRYLSGVCQDYINSVNGRCENPYKDRPESNYLGDDCKEILNKMNYTTCYNDHKQDDGFLLPNFYIWVGQNILDSRHDRLWLFDQDNKLVDEYLY